MFKHTPGDVVAVGPDYYPITEKGQLLSLNLPNDTDFRVDSYSLIGSYVGGSVVTVPKGSVVITPRQKYVLDNDGHAISDNRGRSISVDNDSIILQVSHHNLCLLLSHPSPPSVCCSLTLHLLLSRPPVYCSRSLRLFFSYPPSAALIPSVCCSHTLRLLYLCLLSIPLIGSR